MEDGNSGKKNKTTLGNPRRFLLINDLIRTEEGNMRIKG